MVKEVDMVKPKKKQTSIHSMKLTDDGDLVEDITTPIVDKDERSYKPLILKSILLIWASK